MWFRSLSARVLYSQLSSIRTSSIRILTLRGDSQIPISKGHLQSDGFMDRRILTLRTRGGATEGKERKGIPSQGSPPLPPGSLVGTVHAAQGLTYQGGGYKNFNPWIHVVKFLFRTSPTRILTLGPKNTLSYRGELTVVAAATDHVRADSNGTSYWSIEQQRQSIEIR